MAFKLTFHLGHSDRQDAGGMFAKYNGGSTFVKMDSPFRKTVAVGNPFLYARHLDSGRNEHCTWHIVSAFGDVYKNVFAFAVSDNHRRTLFRHLRCYAILRKHTSAPKSRLFGTYVLAQILSGHDFAD